MKRGAAGQRFLAWVAGWLGPLVVRFWFATIRIRWRGGAFADPDPRHRGHAIHVFWHQRLLCFAYAHRGFGAYLLISRSRDGELIARIVEGLGFAPVRGSSQRGGSGAIRELFAVAEDGRDIGIMPDGPRGPARKFKMGAVYLASRTGLPIVPITVSYRRFWSMRSWDRLHCPWPFTSAVIQVGDPISIPPALDATELEGWRLRLEEALETLTTKTDECREELYRGGWTAGSRLDGAA
ncbi:MAG TPA: lysophospholipid acyltransferase family protein [Candidatus Sulfotelmatobacter sp.]|nr:lysophospholipid acyltransferase family protein [Candidatus Sulfotelmatobacter sp.]